MPVGCARCGGGPTVSVADLFQDLCLLHKPTDQPRLLRLGVRVATPSVATSVNDRAILKICIASRTTVAALLGTGALAVGLLHVVDRMR